MAIDVIANAAMDQLKILQDEVARIPSTKTITVRMADEVGGGGIGSSVKAEERNVETAAANMSGAVQRSSDDVRSSMSKTDSEVTSHSGSIGSNINTMGTRVSGGLDNMGGAMSRTRGNLSGLTGGFAGFIPLLAGFSVYSAVSQFGALSKSVEDFKVMSGLSAQAASKWVGVANQMGVPAAALAMGLKGIGAAAMQQQAAIEKAKGSMGDYQAKVDAVKLAQDSYNTTVAKWGTNSDAALASHDKLIKAEQALQKATDAAGGSMSKQMKAARDLGVSLVDSNGKMRDTNSILMDLADAYSKSTNKEQAAQDMLAILGGRARSLLPVLAEGSQGILQMMQNTQNAGQVLNEQQLQSGMASYKAMANIKQNLTSIFQTMGRDIAPVIQFISDHAKVFTDIAGAVAALYVGHKLMTFGGGLLKDLKDIAGGADKVLTKLGLLGASKTIGGGGGGALGNVISDTTKGMRVWGGPVEVVGLNGIPNAASNAASGAAGVAEGTALSGGGTAALSGASFGVPSVLSMLGSILGVAGISLGGSMLGSWAGKSVAGAIAPGNQNAQGAGDAIGSIGGGAGAGAIAGTLIFPVVGTLAGAIIGAIVGSIPVIISHWGQVTAGIGTAFQFLSDHIGGGVKTAYQTLSDHVGGFFGKVGDFFTHGLPDHIGGFFRSVPGAVGGFFGKIGDFFTKADWHAAGVAVHDAVGWFFGQVGGFFHQIPGRIADGVSAAAGAARDFFTKGVGGFFHDLPGHIADGFNAAKTGVGNFLTKGVGGFFHDLPGNIVGFFNNAKGGVTGFLGGVGDFFRGLPNNAKNFFTNVWSGLTGFLGTVASKFTGFIGGVGNWMGGIWGAVTGFFGSIIGGIGHIVSGAYQWLSDHVGGFLGGLFGGKEHGGEVGRMLPHAAYGASPSAGEMYMVGEQGPELFIPWTSGQIVPNSGLNAFMSQPLPMGGGRGNGGDTYIFDLRGSQVMSDRDMDVLIDKMERRIVTSRFTRAGVRVTRS